MSESYAMVPPPVSANAMKRKRLGFAFGPRFFLLLMIGLVWLIPALIDLRFLYCILAWDIALLAAWIADLSKLPQPELLTITRSWNAPPSLSVTAGIRLTLENRSGTALHVSLMDNIPRKLRVETPVSRSMVPPYGKIEMSYEIRPAKRGEFMLESVYIRYQGLFRISERWALVKLHQDICVYPNLEEARRHSIYLIRSRQIDLEKRFSRKRGQGREFESLREYRQGDEFRSICWRATARRGKLITRLFQIERNQAIWILLDSGRLMRTTISGLSKLDYAVNAALSLGQVALGSGDRIGLLAYGNKITHRILPNRGSIHFRKLIEQLALVREEPRESNHIQAVSTLLSSQTRRSLVVWITDLAETALTPEVIEAAGQLLPRHFVIILVIGQPDLTTLASQKPASVSQMYLTAAAQEMKHRREVLFGTLRQKGAMVMEIESGRASSTAVNAYLEVKQRNLI